MQHTFFNASLDTQVFVSKKYMLRLYCYDISSYYGIKLDTPLFLRKKKRTASDPTHLPNIILNLIFINDHIHTRKKKWRIKALFSCSKKPYCPSYEKLSIKNK